MPPVDPKHVHSKSQGALAAAAMPDRERTKRVRIALVAGAVSIAIGGIVMAARTPDPLDGERPPAAQIAKVPRAQLALERYYRKHGRPPSPGELAAAMAKDRGAKIEIVGPGKRRPHALRLAGTAAEPALELLDGRGNVALYGETPVVVKVRVP